MQKQTQINQIEITSNGTLQVRIALQIVDAGSVVANKWHRTAFPPGCDIDAQCSAVAAHLSQMNEAPLLAPDIQKVKDFAAVAWTPEVVTTYMQAQAASAL